MIYYKFNLIVFSVSFKHDKVLIVDFLFLGRIKWLQGDILDNQFSSIDTALLHIVNCIGVKPHGLSADLAQHYPYCNVYAKRKPIGKLNRADRRCRPFPGTIGVSSPPDDDENLPFIVSLVGQFYMGKEKGKNIMTKKLLRQLLEDYDEKRQNTLFGNQTNNNADLHLLTGLREDTAKHRLYWFKKSLQQLRDFIVTRNIKRIVFPFKIGCGFAGGDWSRDYYPTIEEFSSSLDRSVEVVIICKNSDEKTTSH